MSLREAPHVTATETLAHVTKRGGPVKRKVPKWVFVFVAPLVVFTLVVFIAPLINLAVQSLFITDPDTGQTSFSFDAFVQAFADDYARETVWRTIRIGILTTLLTLVLAYPVVLWSRQISARARGVLVTVLLSPLLMSVVVRTLGWVVLLGPNGFVNDLLERLGIPAARILYTEGAMVFGLAQVFLGFMVLSLLTSVLTIPDNIIAAGGNLGATRWQVLWRIVVPMSVPGIVAGAAIVFPLAASAYVTPALLGGSKNPVLATEVYNQAIHLLNFERASALAVVLFIVIAVGVGLLGLLQRQKQER